MGRILITKKDALREAISEPKKDIATVLKEDFSEDFVQKMRNRIATSHFKYGPASIDFPEVCHAIGTALLEIATYYETGNTEYLVDAANYVMLEYMFPSLPEARFSATDSNKSPGHIKRVIKPWEVKKP
jgi:hypothetical protein